MTAAGLRKIHPPASAVLAFAAAIAGCGNDAAPREARWRTDCPARESAPPLSMREAIGAQRKAEQRHELRLREAAVPGFFLRSLHEQLDDERIADGRICLNDLADLGESVFEHEFGFRDGLGSANAANATKGPFRRVHEGLFGGPETVSCTSCHWIGGPAGAGAETDNAFLFGDGRRPESGDARNPPALLGLGVVQALAAEMTQELHTLRAQWMRELSRPGSEREIELTAKGVGFGTLRAADDGSIDSSGIRGIDDDLIVKPFGWKGTIAVFPQFVDEALQMHMGIQSDTLPSHAPAEMLGTSADPRDPDGDGILTEFGRGPAAALNAHLAVLEIPVVRPLIQQRALGPAARGLLAPTTTNFAADFQRGRRVFHEIGCAGCHVPMLVLSEPLVRVDGMPPIDLSHEMRNPAIGYDPAVAGYPVWLFSDLKRHDMGAANAARHRHNGVARREYLTPRLWGVADSAPYLHDGRAPSFDYAIAGHGGEGAAARKAFAGLDGTDQGALRVYLMSLRRGRRVIVP